MTASSTASVPALTPTAPAGARARVRAELTREITDVAREHLAREGAAALSLRAVSRDLGMSSSAVYRYFPSRDALLTQLIIDAYDSLGHAVEDADSRLAARHPADYGRRTQNVFRTVRSWARAHPHEWALIYGSPVPGYAAPEDTVGPATRVALVLLRLLFAAADAGALVQPALPLVPGAASLGGFAEVPEAAVLVDLPGGADLLATAVAVRAAVYGVISFELNGQHHQIVGDDDAFFEGSLTTFMAVLGQRVEA